MKIVLNVSGKMVVDVNCKDETRESVRASSPSRGPTR